MPGLASRENGKKGGRPKGSASQETLGKIAARERLREIIMSRMEPMTRAQMAAAEGINVAVVRRPDGTFRRIDSPEAFDAAAEAGDPITITTLQPSTQAFTDLMNRALDKPAEQKMEVSGDFTFSWRPASSK